MVTFLFLASMLFGFASYDQCATDEALAGDWDGYVAAMEDGKTRWNPDDAKKCD